MNKLGSSIDVSETTSMRPQSITIHGIHSLIDQGIVSVASFATMALVGRVGKGELGIFALGISSFWLLAGVSNALVWTPYTARAARMSVLQRERFRGDIAGLNLAIGAVFAMLCLIVAATTWVLSDTQTWLTSFCFSFAPLILMLSLREHARRVYIADFEGAKLLAFDVPISLIMVALAILFWQHQWLGSDTAMLLTSAAAIPAIYVTAKHMREGGASAIQVRQALASNWPYGKWLLVVAVAWLASDGILRWMLVGISGQRAMGAFAGAFLIVSLLNPILLAMTSFARALASRKLASGSRQALSTGTILSVRRLAVFAVLACSALHLWGDASMVTILGESYSNPKLVTLLAIAVCLDLVIVPVEAFFVALEFGRLMSLVAVGRLITSILLGILLIPIYGVFGVAWAMLGRSVMATGMYGFALVVAHRSFSSQMEARDKFEIGTGEIRKTALELSHEEMQRIPVST